jgi:hypothetical protein
VLGVVDAAIALVDGDHDGVADAPARAGHRGDEAVGVDLADALVARVREVDVAG